MVAAIFTLLYVLGAAVVLPDMYDGEIHGHVIEQGEGDKD